MLTVACLVAAPGAAEEFDVRLRGRAHLRLFADRAALAAHVRDGSPAAVVVDLRDAHGRPTAGTVRAIRTVAPRLPLFVRCRLEEADCRALLDFARAGVTDVVVHGTSYAPLLAALDADGPVPTVAAEVAAHLRSIGVPPALLPLLEAALADVAMPDALTRAARARGVSATALRRRLARAHLPAPRQVAAALRLLAAATRLRHAHASVERTAHAVGFASANALRNALHRVHGATPTQLRTAAGYDAFVAHVSGALVAVPAATASRVAERPWERGWYRAAARVRAMRGDVWDVRRYASSRALSGHVGRGPRSAPPMARRIGC